MSTSAEPGREDVFLALSTMMGVSAADETVAGEAMLDTVAFQRELDGLLNRLTDSLVGHAGDTALALATLDGENPWDWLNGPTVDRADAKAVADTLGGVVLAATVASSDAGVAASEPATADLQLGSLTREQVGRYRIAADDAEVGRGGIGRVVAALDEHLGREVAVKELRRQGPAGAGPSAAQMRFVHEARVTGQLEHPSIVPVHELGQRADGTLYYTMKLVRGRTLSEAVGQADGLQGRLGLLAHFRDLCQAVAYAHDRGVIHRDIKPANVMVGEFGETVVLDWGLAKIVGSPEPPATDEADATDTSSSSSGQRPISASGRSDTQYGQALGTPSYMSPEQALGELEQLGPPADVWGLGAVLYVLLTGRPPHVGTSVTDVLRRVASEDVPAVHEHEPRAPGELVAICQRALSRDIGARYPDAKALAQEVEAYLVGHRVAAYQYSSMELLRRFVARNKALTAAVATALVAVVVGSALLFDAWRDADTQRVAATDNAAEAKRQAKLAEGNAKKEAAANLEAQRAATEASNRERQAHANLATALAEKAQRRLGQGDANAALMYAAAAIRESPVTPRGPYNSGGAVDDSDGARAVRLSLRSTWAQAGRRASIRLERVVESPSRTRDIAVAPSRKLFVLGQGNGTLELRDVATGTLLRTTPSSLAAFQRFSWLDPTTLAIIGDDNEVRFERASDGMRVSAPLRPFPSRSEVLVNIEASPDGRHVAVGTESRVGIWRMADRKLVAQKKHAAPYQMVWSPDSQRLLAGSGYHGPVLLGLDGKATSWPAHDGMVPHVAFSPDGRFISTCAPSDGVRTWDAKTLKLVHQWRQVGGMRLQYHPTKPLLAVGVEREVALLDTNTFTVVNRWLAHTNRTVVVQWADGDRLVTRGHYEKGALVWRMTATADHERLGPFVANVTAVLAGKDGTLYVGTVDGRVEATSPGGSTATYGARGVMGEIEAVAASPDGSRLVALDQQARVQFWDRGGKLLESANMLAPNIDRTVRSVVLEPTADGSGVWVWHPYFRWIRRMSWEGKVLETVRFTGIDVAVGAPRHSGLLPKGDLGGRVVVFDIHTDTVVSAVDVGDVPAVVESSRDGRHVAWVGIRGSVGVVDVKAGRVLWRRSERRRDVPASVTWVEDAEPRLLVHLDANTAFLLDARTGRAQESYSEATGRTSVTRAFGGWLYEGRRRYVVRTRPGRNPWGRAPSELLDAASAQTGLTLKGLSLEPAAVAIRHVDPHRGMTHALDLRRSRTQGGAIEGTARVFRGGPLSAGTAELMDIATGRSLLTTSVDAKGQFRFDVTGLGDQKPPFGIRVRAGGDVGWTLNPRIRPGRAGVVASLLSERNMRMYSKGLGLNWPKGTALVGGSIHWGDFRSPQGGQGVGCATIQAPAGVHVTYIDAKGRPRKGGTDDAGLYIVTGVPLGKPVRLTATVGAAQAFVDLPPLSKGETALALIPFHKRDFPKHPSPTSCD